MMLDARPVNPAGAPACVRVLASPSCKANIVPGVRAELNASAPVFDRRLAA
ncbi:MAG: hypothetical protein R3A47_11710 [Polyangiales bacterium]